MSFLLTIEPHRESWKEDFAQEARHLEAALGPALRTVQHIGSTAIPGIFAKPIIDLLLEVESLDALDARQRAMEALGYEAMGEFGIPGRRYFRKNNAAGMRTHQAHAFLTGSPDIVRHVAFRDYLRKHPAEAREYSELKLRLMEVCHGKLEAYIDGKEAFVKAVERRALAWRAGGGKGPQFNMDAADRKNDFPCHLETSPSGETPQGAATFLSPYSQRAAPRF